MGPIGYFETSVKDYHSTGLIFQKSTDFINIAAEVGIHGKSPCFLREKKRKERISTIPVQICMFLVKDVRTYVFLL
jgi:hypothetical protein